MRKVLEFYDAAFNGVVLPQKIIANRIEMMILENDNAMGTNNARIGQLGVEYGEMQAPNIAAMMRYCQSSSLILKWMIAFQEPPVLTNRRA